MTWYYNVNTIVCVCVLVTQSCPTLCDPMDYNPPGSYVLEILQARTLEWIAISFSNTSEIYEKIGEAVYCVSHRMVLQQNK